MATKPWADQPFALLPIPGSNPTAPTSSSPTVLSICAEMANVHNIILRDLNSIYLQAPHVTQPADIMDLMFYIKAWAGAVHVHHSHEETILFPRITELAKEAGLDAAVMNSNTEQHHAFEDGLKETLVWAEEVREGKREFDNKALLELINSFAPVLTQHLHDEIKSLVKLDKCDAKRLKKAMVDTANAALKDADPYVELPQALGCVDKGYPGGENFPPVPFFLPYLNAYWFTRRHQGVWRFNPCDHWGKPRPLHFL